MNTNKAYNLFLDFCKIPHASFNTADMNQWIKDYAASHGLHIQEDHAKNLLLSKGVPRLCLQAHYDMVLVGKDVEPIENDGYLCSKDSSLGADNGAALCAALCVFDEVANLELLITNDEEVGMIGANNLELRPQSKVMINIDSEDINEIIIGCAGGVDVEFCFDNLPLIQNEERLDVYQIDSIGFVGGHSGIDIDKDIPNAITSLAAYIKSLDEAQTISINGGTKRNAIAPNAHALILSRTTPTPNPSFKVTPFMLNPPYKDHSTVIELLNTPILQGVQKKSEFGVELSSNIGIVDDEPITSIHAMVRSNDTTHLEDFVSKLHKYARGYGAEIKESNFYPAWEATKGGNLREITLNAFKAHNKNPSIKTIHAGLECGILKSKLELDEILSIGPTIHNPHSKKERLEIKSFHDFCKILLDIIKRHDT